MNPKICFAAALTALLAACGGGHDDTAAVPAPSAREVPASATASPQAYTAYVGSLAPSDVDEPLAVDKVVAPVSETDEPVDLT